MTNNPISPEQALEIAKEAKACVTQCKHLIHAADLADQDCYLFTPKQFQAALNAAITKYFGEPVAWINMVPRPSGPDGSDVDFDAVPSFKKEYDHDIALYARKE